MNPTSLLSTIGGFARNIFAKAKQATTPRPLGQPLNAATSNARQLMKSISLPPGIAPNFS